MPESWDGVGMMHVVMHMYAPSGLMMQTLHAFDDLGVIKQSNTGGSRQGTLLTLLSPAYQSPGCGKLMSDVLVVIPGHVSLVGTIDSFSSSANESKRRRNWGISGHC